MMHNMALKSTNRYIPRQIHTTYIITEKYRLKMTNRNLKHNDLENIPKTYKNEYDRMSVA